MATLQDAEGRISVEDGGGATVRRDPNVRRDVSSVRIAVDKDVLLVDSVEPHRHITMVDI